MVTSGPACSWDHMQGGNTCDKYACAPPQVLMMTCRELNLA